MLDQTIEKVRTRDAASEPSRDVEMISSDAALGECDDDTVAKIGKKGAIAYNEGNLSIEHPTWMNAVGTDYVNLSEFVAEQMVLLSASNNKVSPKELSFLTETVMGIAPRDHVEMMLSTQMAAVHLMTMNMATRARRAESAEMMESLTRQTNQLMRTFAAQTEALKKYRTGGKQHVTVKHVHVHEGGQAIVGNVTHGEGANEGWHFYLLRPQGCPSQRRSAVLCEVKAVRLPM